MFKVQPQICKKNPLYISGADPGFVVGGGGRPQRVQGRALVGGLGGEAPGKLWGFEELQTFI